MGKKDAVLRKHAEDLEQMQRTGLPFTSLPMPQPKLSSAQQDIIWKMQHGRQLVKHPIHCGDPSTFWLEMPGQTELADKRSVNGLIKRGFVIHTGKSESNPKLSVFRLSALGRQVVCNG